MVNDYLHQVQHVDQLATLQLFLPVLLDVTVLLDRHDDDVLQIGQLGKYAHPEDEREGIERTTDVQVIVGIAYREEGCHPESRPGTCEPVEKGEPGSGERPFNLS
jgi:hypothetical protein